MDTGSQRRETLARDPQDDCKAKMMVPEDKSMFQKCTEMAGVPGALWHCIVQCPALSLSSGPESVFSAKCGVAATLVLEQ